MNNQEQESVRLTKYGLAILAIAAFGVFLRLYNLDFMAYHHDESIHASHSYNLFKSLSHNSQFQYRYDPVYHGPFLYHFGALNFYIFGDSDYTGRLPFALFGILLLYFVWRLKPFIGPVPAFFCLLFIAVSPTITYFSRFARNDVYMAAMTMGIIVYALEYLRHRRGIHLVGMTFFLALMYCTKENSYMTGFFLGSFIVFYGMYYFFSHPPQARVVALKELFVERAPFVKLLGLYAIYSCAAFTLVYFVTRYFSQSVRTSHDISIFRDAWNTHTAENAWIVPLWTVMALATAAALFFLIGWLGKQVEPQEATQQPFFRKFAQRNVWLVVSLFVAFFIYSLLFTTMGTHPGGMKAGVVDYLLYWMGQQGEPRIPGPPDYFIPRLLVYELSAMLFGGIAFFAYLISGLGLVNFAAFFAAFSIGVYTYARVFLYENLSLFPSGILYCLIGLIAAGVILFIKYIVENTVMPQEDSAEAIEKEFALRRWLQPDGIRIFLIYWSIGSLLVYALLNEKVPWLIVHQSLPLLLLAGVFMGDLWNTIKPGAFRKVFACLIAVFAIYQAQAAIGINFYRPDDPRELLVYTQTGHDAVKIAEQIKQAAYKLGHEYRPPNATKPIAFVQGQAVWPYVWYLRDYRVTGTHHGENYNFNPPPPEGIPFVLIDTKHQDQMKVWSKGQYAKTRVRHRVWWRAQFGNPGGMVPSTLFELPFHYYAQKNRPISEAFGALLRYMLYREVWEPQDPALNIVSTPILFYHKQPVIENESRPEVAQGYEQAPRPLQFIKTVGSQGQGDAQFIEPRGVALSPDGSLVFVLDSRNARIQVFDSELNYVTQFGQVGNGPGEFSIQYNAPNGGIDVGPNRRIFATNTWAEGGGRINRYENDTQPLPPLTRTGGKSFYYPRGLTVTRDGSLFVSDTGNKEIVKFDPQGNFRGVVNIVRHRPNGTTSVVAVNEPVGITDGPDGNLYVCDVGNQRIISFTPQGHFIRSWPVLGWNPEEPSAISWVEPYVAVDNQGYVYATDSTKDVIHCFSPDGSRVFLGGGPGGGRGQLNDPKGIAVDSEGNLYIADSLNHRIVKATLPK